MSLPLTRLAPLLSSAAALVALARPGRRPGRAAALGRIGDTVRPRAGRSAGWRRLVLYGPVTLALGSGPLALILRLDVLGAVVTTLVGFIGWVVRALCAQLPRWRGARGRLPWPDARHPRRRTGAGAWQAAWPCWSRVSSLSGWAFGGCCSSTRPGPKRGARRPSSRWSGARAMLALILAAAASVDRPSAQRISPRVNARRFGRPAAAACPCATVPAGAGGRAQDRRLPAAWLADRGDGGAHAGFRPAACRHHQCRRRAADPPGRGDAGEPRRHGGAGDAGRLDGPVRRRW